MKAQILFAMFVLVGCTRSEAATSDPAAAPSPVAKAAPVEAKPIDKVLSAKTLPAAYAVAKPHMDDSPNSIGIGTALLGAWAAKSMRWSDVAVDNNETTYALVRKDPDEERGKRMCVPGDLIQIEVDKSEFGKLYEGLLLSEAGNIYHFTAAGTSGTLVAQNHARFCGVVTGNYDYSNSGGGQGHAVKLVGMFDLPANRAAK